ncbi:hypothetical protein NCCP133_16900 [Cytobacillus sp. NCCP-133]|nr:hypothetical protein NCCP133_16900 [Cytobacillus sp. NCCP-133]
MAKELDIYLDESMKRFETLFPACGSSNSAIELTPAEIEEYSPAKGWVDVCKGWEAELIIEWPPEKITNKN